MTTGPPVEHLDLAGDGAQHQQRRPIAIGRPWKTGIGRSWAQRRRPVRRSSAVTVPRPSTTTMRSPSTIPPSPCSDEPAHRCGPAAAPGREVEGDHGAGGVDASGVEHEARSVDQRQSGHRTERRGPPLGAGRAVEDVQLDPAVVVHLERHEPGAVVGDHLTARRAVDRRRPAGGAGGDLDAGDAAVLGGHDGDRSAPAWPPARRCDLGRTGRRSSTRQREAPRRTIERLEAVDRADEHRLGIDGDERLGVLHVDPPTGRAVGDADRRHGVRLDHERVVAVDEERSGVGEALDAPPERHRVHGRVRGDRPDGGRLGAAIGPTEITEQAARREHQREDEGGTEDRDDAARPAPITPADAAAQARFGAGGRLGIGMSGFRSTVMLRPPCLVGVGFREGAGTVPGRRAAARAAARTGGRRCARRFDRP